MKKLSIFVLAAALLAGCTEIPKELSVLTATPARSISYNGMTLAETGETSFNLGRFQNLPRVRSTEDINALDSAIMTYGDIQKRTARKGDWETMMTARHLLVNASTCQVPKPATRWTITSQEFACMTGCRVRQHSRKAKAA